MKLVNIFYQVRRDGGVRFGFEVDGEIVLHDFREGHIESDPVLVWYIDSKCKVDDDTCYRKSDCVGIIHAGTYLTCAFVSMPMEYVMCLNHQPNRVLYIALLSMLMILSGCNTRHCYEIKCVISDAVSKQPLEGVQLTINTKGQKDNKATDTAFEHETDKQGMSDIKLVISGEEFTKGMPQWYLKIEKAAYIAEVIDISPRTEPDPTSHEKPMSTTIIVYLQPVKR